MTTRRLISSDEIGDAWDNINADWPQGRFQDLRRLVKDTLHDARIAVEAFEDAARKRALASGVPPHQQAVADLIADMTSGRVMGIPQDEPDVRARKAGLGS